MIQVLQPAYTESDIAAVSEAIRSCWWGLGPRCAELEKELAERGGYKHAVTVNSATSALHLALVANDIGRGDEVIVPALTFISTALAVTYTGATPVFADVDPATLTLNWRDVRSKITWRTKAVIPVDYAGQSAWPSALPANIAVIEDAAHNVLGAHYGDMVCYSFHPVKQLATADGGAILTNSASQAERLQALRWCGIDRSTWQRSGKRYSWDYNIAEAGYKYHFNDVQAALALSQLKRWDEIVARRRAMVDYYFNELRGIDGLELPADSASHTWHLFVVRVAAEKRDGLLDYLAEKGIGAGVHYKPLTHYKPYLQETPPMTEKVWRKLVTLPLHLNLSEADQALVCTAVKEYLVK